jgi:hypothetical protein
LQILRTARSISARSHRLRIHRLGALSDREKGSGARTCCRPERVVRLQARGEP